MRYNLTNPFQTEFNINYMAVPSIKRQIFFICLFLVHKNQTTNFTNREIVYITSSISLQNQKDCTLKNTAMDYHRYIFVELISRLEMLKNEKGIFICPLQYATDI